LSWAELTTQEQMWMQQRSTGKTVIMQMAQETLAQYTTVDPALFDSQAKDACNSNALICAACLQVLLHLQS